jgi:holdfast attachment protein HfaA
MHQRLAVIGAFALAAAPCWATAQSHSDLARLNAGYGRTFGQENTPVDPSTRDPNGNRVIVDGIMQTGAGQGFYSRDDAYGSNGALAGYGGITATATGNQLIILTQGSWNTVVVDSTQINNGDVSASVELNGKVNLDAPQ